MDTYQQRYDVQGAGDTGMKTGLLLPTKRPHSLTDWDFDGLGAWHADAVTYRSVPTSITCYSSEVGGYRHVYLKTALAANVPDGRIETYCYLRNLGTGWIDFMFRTQAKPASGYPANSYLVRLVENHLWFYRIVAGVWASWYDVVPPHPPVINEWEHWLVSWWQYLNASMQNVLRVRVDREIADFYHQEAASDDDQNLWAESGTNRMGFVLQRIAEADRTNIDDTSLYRRTG